MESFTYRDVIKNLAGAFVGGIVGVATGLLLHPGWTPITVLFGVSVGWMHVNIFSVAKNIAESFRLSVRFVLLKRMLRRSVVFLSKITRQISIIGWQLRKRGQKVPSFISSLLRQIGWLGRIVTTSIITAPSRFYNWLRSHPVNQARFLHGVAFLIAVTGGVVALWFIMEPTSTVEAASNEDYGLLFSLAGLVLVVATFALQEFQEDLGAKDDELSNELVEMRKFYRTWNEINQHGKAKYFLRKLMVSVHQTAGVALFLSIALAWAFSFMIIGFLGVYIALILVVTAHQTWDLIKTRKRRFWVCYGVTLATVLASLFIYGGNVSSLVAGALLSVSTGVAAGIITLPVQYLLVYFYEQTKIGQRLASKESDDLIFGESGSYISFMTKSIAVWFRQNKAAYALRTICFGTPLKKRIEA